MFNVHCSGQFQRLESYGRTEQRLKYSLAERHPSEKSHGNAAAWITRELALRHASNCAFVIGSA